MWAWLTVMFLACAAIRADRRVSVFIELDGPAIADLDLAQSDSRGARPATLPIPDRAALRDEIRQQQNALSRPLAAIGGSVIGRYAILARAVRARVPESAIPELSKLSGVRRVQRAHVYRPFLETSVPWVHGPEAWSSIASGLTGHGIRLGIIDSGIDYNHADFGGSGTIDDYDLNDPTVIEEGSFPTDKVVGGTDFVGDAYDASDPANNVPVPDPDPLDPRLNGHGSHVAGIAGGMGVEMDGRPYTGSYDVPLDFSKFKIGPGVAPQARLYALKIFGVGGSDAVVDALEWAADPDADGNTTDRLDVVNLSLGGDFGVDDPNDVELKAVDKLARLGCVVVIAAGNAGNTSYILGNPAVAPRAIAVANSVDNGAGLFAIRVLSPAAIATNLLAMEGQFTPRLSKVGDITADVVATDPIDACADLLNSEQLDGKLVLIDRGTCLFVEKFRRAQAAGAIGVIMVNNQTDGLITMSGDNADDITIPGVLISKADGAILRAQLKNGVRVTLGSNIHNAQDTHEDGLQDSSSRGPVFPSNRLKPDLTAPGTSIQSAAAGGGSEGVLKSGTSMSAPHVAGAAALLREAHPDWPADDIKAALMNSAIATSDAKGNPYPESRIGAGRLRVDAAARTEVIAKAGASGEVSFSFGAYELSDRLAITRSLRIVNHARTPVTLDLSVRNTVAEPGVVISLSSTNVTVTAGGTLDVDIRLDVDPYRFQRTRDESSPATIDGVPRPQLPESSGEIWLRNSTTAVHVPWYLIARAAAQRSVGIPSTGLPAGNTGSIRLRSRGASAHSAPFVAAFQLGLIDSDERFTDRRASTDVIAVGAACDRASAGSLGSATVYFGIGVAGHWLSPTRALNDYDIEIDLDEDDQPDYVLANGNSGTFDAGFVDAYGASSDALETLVMDTRFFGNLSRGGPLNVLRPGVGDGAVFLNGVLIHSARASSMGLTVARSKFRYRVVTRGEYDNTTDWATFDAAMPVLDPTPQGLLHTPIFPERDGATVSFDRNAAAIAGFDDANPPQLLLLHMHNETGKHHEIVHLSLATSDVDSDGLEDALELAHFGDLSHDGTADSDGDGQTDAQEIQAGSNPMGPLSPFHLEVPIRLLEGPGLLLRWASLPGLSYAVERADQPDGPYATVRNGITATTAQTEFADPAAIVERPVFYRVRVE